MKLGTSAKSSAPVGHAETIDSSTMPEPSQASRLPKSPLDDPKTRDTIPIFNQGLMAFLKSVLCPGFYQTIKFMASSMICCARSAVLASVMIRSTSRSVLEARKRTNSPSASLTFSAPALPSKTSISCPS